MINIYDYSSNLTCYFCNGKGCKNCKHTGLIKNDRYVYVVKSKKGKKIAFETNFLGK